MPTQQDKQQLPGISGRFNNITGLPLGHVPRYRPPADNSHLFGSYREEAASLKRAADAAEWAGDTAKADALLAEDRWHSPGTEGRCGIQLPPMLASLTWGKHNSNVITNENTGCSLGEKEAA